MQLLGGYENRKARVEILPLIDVMFLLLVSFVYATLSMSYNKSLRVDLPRGAGVEEKKDQFVITIDSGNALWVGERQVSPGEAVQLAAEASRGDGRGVVVNGDRGAGLGVAVELLSELRMADVLSVSFRATDDK